MSSKLNFSSPGWKCFYSSKGTEIFGAGHLDGQGWESVVSFLRIAASDQILEFCKSLRGEFGLYLVNDDICLAVTDHICSYPISYTLQQENLIFFSNDISLHQSGSLELSLENLCVFQAAGYTIGSDTLYSNATRIEPGTCVYGTLGSSFNSEVRLFATCNSFPSSLTRRKVMESEMLEATISAFERSLQGCDKRPIAIPLSAGFDSRLILSLAKLVGRDQIITYSYGSTGNYEAAIAKKLANHCGVPWYFVKTSPAIFREYTQTQEFLSYRASVSDGISIPIYHDLYVTKCLLEQGVIDQNCIIINGNSGDYISGGHIPKSILNNENISAHEFAFLFREKHFNLWPSYNDNKNDDLILSRIISNINDLREQGESDNAQIWEKLEFDNRQIKNVVKRQKIYDWFDLEWRLPLWDHDYINFWAQVSLTQKRGQSLYQATLTKKNYHQIWQGIPFNEDAFVSPPFFRWVIRPFFKFLIGGLFGKKRWKIFEMKFLSYYIDNMGLQGINTYLNVVRLRLFRNYISLHCKDYVEWRFNSTIGERVVEEDI